VNFCLLAAASQGGQWLEAVDLLEEMVSALFTVGELPTARPDCNWVALLESFGFLTFVPD